MLEVAMDDTSVRELTMEEMQMVSGGGVSAETIGCAVGGLVGARAGGDVDGAVGCVAGAAIANADYSNSNASYFGNAWSIWNYFQDN